MNPFPDNYIKLIVAVDQLITSKTEPGRLSAMSEVMNRMEICRKDLLAYSLEALNNPTGGELGKITNEQNQPSG